MKIKLSGEGKLNPVVKGYLTLGKVYEGRQSPVFENLCIIEDDDGDEITINVKIASHCGHICDSYGNIYWEVVDAN